MKTVEYLLFQILMSVNEQRRTSVTPTPYALTLKASIYAAV